MYYFYIILDSNVLVLDSRNELCAKTDDKEANNEIYCNNICLAEEGMTNSLSYGVPLVTNVRLFFANKLT